MSAPASGCVRGIGETAVLAPAVDMPPLLDRWKRPAEATAARMISPITIPLVSVRSSGSIQQRSPSRRNSTAPLSAMWWYCSSRYSRASQSHSLRSSSRAARREVRRVGSRRGRRQCDNSAATDAATSLTNPWKNSRSSAVNPATIGAITVRPSTGLNNAVHGVVAPRPAVAGIGQRRASPGCGRAAAASHPRGGPGRGARRAYRFGSGGVVAGDGGELVDGVAGCVATARRCVRGGSLEVKPSDPPRPSWVSAGNWKRKSAGRHRNWA